MENLMRTKEEKIEFIKDLRASADALANSGIVPPSTLIDHYSLRNCFTILSQRIDATHCAGFHAWRDAGRIVRKGSRGIAILVPLGAKDDENPMRWSWRYVFDISDTDPITSDSPTRLRDLINA